MTKRLFINGNDRRQNLWTLRSEAAQDTIYIWELQTKVSSYI